MVKQDYNRMADAYGRNRKIHPLVLERLIEIAELDTDSRVLEVGCGTGNYIRAIASHTGAVCTGVDPSQEMLRIARSNVGLPTNRRQLDAAEVTFIKASAEELPVADRQLDLVFSVDVVHHIRDRDGAAAEAFRVLKPAGVAVIATESDDDLHDRMPLIAYFPEIITVELERYPSIGEIEFELRNAGFQPQEQIPVSMPKVVTDIRPYRDKALSSLHLISDETFAAGIARMERDLLQGPIQGNRRYTMVIARRPA